MKCRICDIEKSIDDYYRSPNYSSGYFSYCKTCYKEKHAYRSASGNPRQLHLRNMRNIKCQYGITEIELRTFLDSQKGCCALCGVDFGDELMKGKLRQYHIDHDHTTGKVRGLLCPDCNTLLGRVEKRRVNPKRIAAYLELPWELL